MRSFKRCSADYQVAIQRLQDPSDEMIDEAELRRRIGWVTALVGRNQPLHPWPQEDKEQQS